MVGIEGEAGPEVCGWLALYEPQVLAALHVLQGLVRSPVALAAVLETAGAGVELLPEVVSNLATFDAAVAEVAAAMAEQDVLASQMRALVRRRNEAIHRATDMRIRLAGQIKGALGDTSEQLRRFGIKPIRRRGAALPGLRLPDPS